MKNVGMQEHKLGVTRAKDLLFNYNSVCIFLLLLIFGSIFVDHFTTNISTILVETSIYGFVAVGLSLVMLTGNIDLSVGFQLSSASVVTVLTLNATGSLVVAFLAGLLTGVLVGVINGLVVVGLGVNSLIATMAIKYIYQGFTYFFTKNGAMAAEGDLKSKLRNVLAHNQLGGIKVLTVTVIIFAVILVIITFVLYKTRFGISLYITGDNAEAGDFAGVNIKRAEFMAFVLCGVLCSLAGIFFASNSGTAVYTQGEGRDVFAMSACIIGGIKMSGGRGTMLNVLLGVLVMRIISTMMNLMLIPSQINDLISGSLLILVLIIDHFTALKKEDD